MYGPKPQIEDVMAVESKGL